MLLDLAPCQHRQPSGTNGDIELFDCRHPRVVAPFGQVTAQTCATCRQREIPSQKPSFIPEAMTIPSGRRTNYRCDVVIPYYQNLQWVPQAIDSILWQQSVECCVHMVNDDSPEDDTWLRRAYAGRANILWYRNIRNLGPYRSVHQVWPFLRTDYFAVQDSDDVSYPNRLWFSIHALEENNAEIFGAAMEQFLEPSALGEGEGHREFSLQFPYWHSGQRWATGCPHGVLINGTVVMRRSLFERMNGYHDLICGGDVEFCTRIHYSGVQPVLSSAVVGTRRVNNRSLSRSGPFEMGRPARNSVHDRLARLYAEYEKPGFKPSRYGCLNERDASLTNRLPSMSVRKFDV